MEESELLYQAGLSADWIDEFVIESNKIDPQPETTGLVYEGHREAVLYAIKMAAEGRFALSHEVHKLLLRDHPLAGKFRKRDKKIGINYTLETYLIPYLFWRWNRSVHRTVDFLRKDKKIGPDLKPSELWALHCEFENIHPYEIYNGKTGRVLLLNHALLVDVDPWIIPCSRREEYFDLIRHHSSAEWVLNPPQV